MMNFGILDLLKLSLIFLAVVSYCQASAIVCNSTYSIHSSAAMTTTQFDVPECTNTTTIVVTVPVTLFGINVFFGHPELITAFTPSVDGGSYFNMTPSFVGNSQYLQWDITSNNTCLSIANSTTTSATCQFDLILYNFTTTNYFNYNELYPLSGVDFTGDMIIYRNTSGGCTWTFVQTISINITDCNEVPVIYSTDGVTYTLSEYDGISDASTYYGTISSISVADPDNYTTAYGTVNLNISNITRPLMSNIPIDDFSPFYISNTPFLGNNTNSSTLDYNVTRCSNTTACLAIFDSYADGGTTSQLMFLITATDNGGLSASYSVYVNITEVAPSLSWVNMPGSVSVYENITGPLQVYQMQMEVVNTNSYNYTWQIVISAVTPVVKSTGGPYIGIDTTCNPSVSSPILCTGLNLTSNVTNSTFNFTRDSQYIVTVEGSVSPTAGGFTAMTITSSVTISVLSTTSTTTSSTTTSTSASSSTTVGSTISTSTTTSPPPSSSSGLTDGEIGGIAGGVGGALIIAGLSIAVAKLLQKNAVEKGIPSMMTQPVIRYN